MKIDRWDSGFREGNGRLFTGSCSLNCLRNRTPISTGIFDLASPMSSTFGAGGLRGACGGLAGFCHWLVFRADSACITTRDIC